MQRGGQTHLETYRLELCYKYNGLEHFNQGLYMVELIEEFFAFAT